MLYTYRSGAALPITLSALEGHRSHHDDGIALPCAVLARALRCCPTAQLQLTGIERIRGCIKTVGGTSKSQIVGDNLQVGRQLIIADVAAATCDGLALTASELINKSDLLWRFAVPGSRFPTA